MTEPNEEFYYGLILPMNRDGSWGGNIDDAWMLEIAQEIWAAYPSYVVKYGSRNLLKMFFDPGWLSPRYATTGWTRQGSQFVAGEHTWNTHSADSPYVKESLMERELRESLNLIKLNHFQKLCLLFFLSSANYTKSTLRLFDSRIIVLGWLGSSVWCYYRLIGKRNITFLSQQNVSRSCLSILFVSFILLYENAIVALFVQPHLRYFHMSEPEVDADWIPQV